MSAQTPLGGAEPHQGTRALRRGVLITFEGPDGSGKSTLAAGCRRFLEGEGYGPVGLFREPGSSPAGLRLRALKSRGREAVSPAEELALFIEDRRWDVETNVRPLLERRGVVLLDRYYHSSIAYQGARGLDPAAIRAANEAFAPRPDLVILLRLSVEDCLARIRAGRGDALDLFEQREALERVCALFEAMPDPVIRRLDASRPLPHVQRDVNALALEAVRAQCE